MKPKPGVDDFNKIAVIWMTIDYIKILTLEHLIFLYLHVMYVCFSIPLYHFCQKQRQIDLPVKLTST